MDETSFKLLEKFVPLTYINQAKDAQNTTQLLINQLLEKVFSISKNVSFSSSNVTYFLG